MVEILNDHCEDVTYSNLNFDLKRPTVSEFLRHRVNREYRGHPGGRRIGLRDREGQIRLEGGHWSGRDDGAAGHSRNRAMQRIGWNNPLSDAEHLEDLGDHRVRLTWKNTNHGLRPGQQYQFRPTIRDSVGVHNARSKDIVIRDCDFYALTNMGFVSQFTENITYQRANSCRRQARFELARLGAMSSSFPIAREIFCGFLPDFGHAGRRHQLPWHASAHHRHTGPQPAPAALYAPANDGLPLMCPAMKLP